MKKLLTIFSMGGNFTSTTISCLIHKKYIDDNTIITSHQDFEAITPTNIKLVAVDLDSTLLNSSGEISPTYFKNIKKII